MKNPSVCLFFALAAILPAAEPAPMEKVSAEMAGAANALIQSLDDGQLKKAKFAYDSDERLNWHFIPKERNGLPFADMKPEQRELSRALLKSAMSEKGLLKVDAIIALEGFLAELENNATYRDDKKYYTSIFGDPKADGAWGWRFEGHHISLNFTLDGGKAISVTPSFFAANRAHVTEGRLAGSRPLGAEEDLARTLAIALKESGKPVVYSTESPKDILTGADREVRKLDPVGVPVSEMTDAQKEGLLALISEFTARHRPEIAGKNLEKYKADLATARFGWAGGLEKGEAYYYRIQGSKFLIEVVNFQNDANHIHATWRDFESDFGRDVLGGHAAEH